MNCPVHKERSNELVFIVLAVIAIKPAWVQHACQFFHLMWHQAFASRAMSAQSGVHHNNVRTWDSLATTYILCSSSVGSYSSVCSAYLTKGKQSVMYRSQSLLKMKPLCLCSCALVFYAGTFIDKSVRTFSMCAL